MTLPRPPPPARAASDEAWLDAADEILGVDLVEDLARCPLWQAWLTRGPNGVVVSLFSMP